MWKESDVAQLARTMPLTDVQILDRLAEEAAEVVLEVQHLKRGKRKSAKHLVWEIADLLLRCNTVLHRLESHSLSSSEFLYLNNAVEIAKKHYARKIKHQEKGSK